MRFYIISPVIHKKSLSGYAGYAPYVREMNLWLKHVDEVRVLAPVANKDVDNLEIVYQHTNLIFDEVPPLAFINLRSALRSFILLPYIIVKMISGMVWADHIHLRCPSNMGLIGSVIQLFFPGKSKSVKYANNWDPKSKQFFSYRIQQMILRSRITRNARVLVYGDWNEKSNNIKPFYTATYSDKMKTDVLVRDINYNSTIWLLFVGTITPNKCPDLVLRSFNCLLEAGFDVNINFLGDGVLLEDLKKYTQENNLNSRVFFRGKVSQEDAVHYFKMSHFLVFPSKSEGWPKVVAEAMWWGCLPVTTDVSCVNYMVGDGSRGILVEPDEKVICETLSDLIFSPERYNEMCYNAIEWSRKFSLEKFEKDISLLLYPN
ncbi:glycosyltransferase family 4 protein [Marinilabiliaceae bacterium ANBcel2]|nr:glycosyltransferase family 4 protein [Marinilabiliaceae bacterium ANBcel2]